MAGYTSDLRAMDEDETPREEQGNRVGFMLLICVGYLMAGSSSDLRAMDEDEAPGEEQGNRVGFM